MKLAGKKKRIGDTLSGIEYLDIPKPTEYLVNIPKIVLRTSRKKNIELLILLIIVLIAGIAYCIENDQINNWVSFFGISITLYSIKLIYELTNNHPVLILSSEGIIYKKEIIKWSSISNMYILKQTNGDDNMYELVLEKEDSKVINIDIDWLSINPEKLIMEIGKYYWSWYKANNNES